MHINQQKEQFNFAYVCALAAHAGVNHSKPVVDDDSIDIEFFGRGYMGKPVRNPKIELQLKCTSQDLEAANGGVLKFELSRKNYDDLRHTDLVVPRYLAVLVVHESVDEWLLHHAGHMSLHNVCYWASLRDLPEVANPKSVVVDVPIAQRFDSAALLALLDAASTGVPA